MQRIVAGRFKGRKLLSLPGGVAGLRPMAAKIRGAVFDSLHDATEGARVLDLFAGSGAIGFEALSRGAVHVTFVEQHQKVAARLRDQAKAWGVGPHDVTVVAHDAVRFITRGPVAAGAPAPFDLVFIDPPFAHADVFEPVLAGLVRGWLNPGAYVVCERERVRGTVLPIELPPGLHCAQARTYGQALVEFHQLASDEGDPSCTPSNHPPFQA